jgi:hypothetical protein
MPSETLGLLFEIGADPSKAQAALAKFSAALDRDLGLATGSTQKFAAGALAAGKDLLYLGGVAAGVAAGALALANRWAEAGSAIFEASEKTGLSAASLSGLRTTAKLLNEDFGAVTVTLGRMGRNIEAGLRAPSSEAGKALQGLFKSSDELQKLGLLPLDQRIAEVTKRIFTLNSVSQQNLELQALTGRGYNEVRSTLQELGKGGYDPLIAKAKALGQFFDAEAAERARKFNIQMKELQGTFEALSLSIGQRLVPAMSQLVLLTEIKLQQGLGKTLVQALRDAAAGALWFAAALDPMITKTDAWKDEVDKLALSIAGGKGEIQAMTDALVGFQNLVAAAVKGTGELGNAQDKAAKATRIWTTDVSALAEIYRQLLRAEDPVVRIQEEYLQTLLRIAAAAGPNYNATLLEKMALERRDREILDALADSQREVNRLLTQRIPAPPPLPASLLVPPDFDEGRRRLVLGLNDIDEAFKATIMRLNVEFPHATSFAAQRLGEMGLTFQGTAQRMSEAMGQGIATAILYGRSVGEALRLALKAAVASLAGEALVRAIYSTALGFYLLAIQDYRGAALAFKSAALFGAVGGVAAGVAAAIPGASSGVVGATGASAGGAAATAAPAPPEERKSSVQIIFQGPVYGGQAGIDELTRAISQAVIERDVNLTAYTVVRQPATRA